ncbi:MAG: hypothetical protein ACP5N3_04500 [Candidatus Nanoarchaeia archaeon]
MAKKKRKAAAAKPVAVKKTVKKSITKPVEMQVPATQAISQPAVPVQTTEKPAVQPETKTMPVIQDKKKHNIGLAGFLVNIVLPGLGTLIGFGKEHRTAGVTQFLLFIVGVTFLAINSVVFNIIGWLLIIIMWIWAVGLGITALKKHFN